MSIDLPTGYYVYTICVADVVRYVGKGKGLRLYAHMKEVRSRLKRDYKLANIEPLFQRNLTEAVLSGATVIEQVLIDNLTERRQLTNTNTIKCMNMSLPANANSCGTSYH
jgi:hypothetical protein